MILDVPETTISDLEQQRRHRDRRLASMFDGYDTSHSHPKPVVVNGQWFESAAHASFELGIDDQLIREVCRSGGHHKKTWKRIEFAAHYAAT